MYEAVGPSLRGQIIFVFEVHKTQTQSPSKNICERAATNTIRDDRKTRSRRAGTCDDNDNSDGDGSQCIGNRERIGSSDNGRRKRNASSERGQPARKGGGVRTRQQCGGGDSRGCGKKVAALTTAMVLAAATPETPASVASEAALRT